MPATNPDASHLAQSAASMLDAVDQGLVPSRQEVSQLAAQLRAAIESNREAGRTLGPLVGKLRGAQRKLARTRRENLAAETLSILNAGGYSAGGRQINIEAALRRCVQESRLFEPHELRTISKDVRASTDSGQATAIELFNETTLEGAARVREAAPQARVAVLNFGSAKNPGGGGFLHGSHAQEESLARSSGLYPSLRAQMAFYTHHRYQGNALYSHRVIYSPGVPVFRRDDGELLAEPYQVDFLTCAAPNAGAIKKTEPALASHIEPELRVRAALLLSLAAHLGVTHLVLGAWGCGVFRNEPPMVARIFSELLQREGSLQGRFKRVRFSVLDRSQSKATFGAFQRGLSQAC